MKTEIFFGLKKPDGVEVSDEQFSDFMEDVVTNDLPEGLTLSDAYGQYLQEDGGMLKERTKVMVVFHEESVEQSALIEDIVSSYREEFGGAKVMRATSVSDVRFYVD